MGYIYKGGKETHVEWTQTEGESLMTGNSNSSRLLLGGFLDWIEKYSGLLRVAFWLAVILVCVLGVALGSRWLGEPELTAAAVSCALAVVKLLYALFETLAQLAGRVSLRETSTRLGQVIGETGKKGQQSP